MSCLSSDMSTVLDLRSVPFPAWFYKIENAGHEISGLPMSRNQYDIMSFLSRQVLGDENLAITTNERVPGDTIVRKDFTVQDYILDNLR